MARYLMLLTLALVTATQTAQAFPSIIDSGRSIQASRAESRNSIAIDVMMDVSLVRSYLQILEVAAEEDLAVADAIEPMLELNLDDDAALELMLVLIAMEEDFRLGDVAARTIAITDPGLNMSSWKVEEGEAFDLGRFGSSFYDTPRQRKRR